MEHYTLRSREPFTADRGKSMVDPDHMGGFNVSCHTPEIITSGSEWYRQLLLALA